MSFSVPLVPLPSVLLDMFPFWGALHLASASVGLGVLTPLGLCLFFLWAPPREDESGLALRTIRLGHGYALLSAAVLSGVFGSYFLIPALLGSIYLVLLSSFRSHAMSGGSLSGGEGGSRS